MTILNTLRAAGLAVLFTVTACAQETSPQETDTPTTADDVRAEISDAMDTIASYSEQERDQALAEAREVLNRLDAEIDRREQALRENSSEMSEAARETAEARLRDLRQARNRLGERFDALESGASDSWDELQTGFSNAWGEFSEAWNAADEDDPSN